LTQENRRRRLCARNRVGSTGSAPTLMSSFQRGLASGNLGGLRSG
jgi:hypothetical protein